MKKITLLASLIVITLSLFSQSRAWDVHYGAAADKRVSGAKVVREGTVSNIPSYVAFREGMAIPAEAFTGWMKRYFKLSGDYGFQLKNAITDKLGLIHKRYIITYKGIPVEGSMYIAHIRNGQVVSMNGVFVNNLQLSAIPALSEVQTLEMALDHIGAESYKWEDSREEQHLKWEQRNPNSTYYPKGELVWFPEEADFSSIEKMRLCWKFDVYASKPLYRADVFIDAENGSVVFENNHIHTTDVTGTANTGYSGTQTITADDGDPSPNIYRLRESGRGNGIETYDMNEGTNYGNAVDFEDDDNTWNNVNAQLDEYATDAHWGAEVTYDYFMLEHNRNSIDGNGFALLSYVHYDTDYGNAFWDGQRMTYGDGSSDNPFTALDITGHEITHGLTDFTADLIYQDESGALNESFSDIFGTAVEFYGKPSLANWTVGEDIGFTLRSMSNPPDYNDPECYLGTNWYTGTGDNGGVHTNSGVQNKWFYILSEGETGTNENGDSYSVTGLGIADAGAIAFRTLTVYLTSSSEYADARFYSIQSAIDLFGACTAEVIATTDAWNAVCVGGPWDPTVTADFTADETSSCSAPFTVNFTNMSTNAGTFYWDFGDGSAIDSTANPSHTYNNYGQYTIELIADGGACGSDTTVKVDYITIDSTLACVVIMPTSGSASTQTACDGTVYDDGGPSANYSDNTSSTVTIAPTGATQVTLTFNSFDVEPGSSNNCDYDYVEIYDGPTTSSTLIGRYCNDTGSPGTVNSTGGEITIMQYSDAYVNEAGFDVTWSCTMPSNPPTTAFSVNTDTTCSGIVQFFDESTNAPTSWQWTFGDGDTSTLQDPEHTYLQDGSYTVQLIATNSIGSDTLIQTDYITVNKPAAPSATGDEVCPNTSATLTATGTGTFTWYDDSVAGNQLDTGATYNTPPITATTSYWVEEATPSLSQYVGPLDNTFGTGAYFNNDQHLKFDVFSTCKLVSVWVDAGSSGNRTIELRDNDGNVLQSATINIPAGQGRITLNFSLTPGTDYQLGVSGTGADLYRNDSGPSYPYTLAGFAEITRSSAGTDPYSYYYFFYDWEIKGLDCISERAEVIADTLSAPTVSASGGTTICAGDTVTLSASGTDITSYSWSPGGETTSSISVNPSSTTIFTVTASNNCSNATDTVTVNVTPLASVTAPNDITICDGDTVTLSATGTGDFSWSPGGETTASITVTPTASTTYTVTASNSCGFDSDSVTVTLDSVAVVSVSPDVTICPGDTADLTATGNGSFLWSPGGQTTSSISVTPAATTTYYVTLTSNCGTANDSVKVSVLPSTTVSASADAAICEGDSTTLTANGNGNLDWSPGGQTGSSITVGPSATTTYTVTATGTCGTATDDVTVTVNPLPVINSISPDTSVCEGETVTLTASGNGSYNWQPGGQSTSSITVSPGASTTYTCAVSNSCGSASDETTVIVNPLPLAGFSYSSSGLTVSFSDTSANTNTASWSWDFGDGNTSTQQNPTHIYTASGSYNVVMVVTNSCGNDTARAKVGVEGTGLVESILFNSLKIYPNPASTQLQVQFTVAETQDIEVQLMNVLGQEMIGDKLDRYTGTYVKSFDLNGLATGLYFLQIEHKDGIITRKVVLK